MKHLDLFSGIGGFALAANTVWGKDYQCVGFCDIEPYAQNLLKLRWPGVKIYDDIRTLSAQRLNADINGNRQSKRKEEKHTTKRGQQAQYGIKGRVDLLTGGFPCQPFSIAGMRKGTTDDRHLWPEMLRVIKEVRPRWIIGENVAGLLTMAQHKSEIDVESEADNEGSENTDNGTNGIVWDIIKALEEIGYSVQPFVIPACAVNAPHRRDRIWIVAHARREHGTRAKKQGKYEKENRKTNAIKFERPVERHNFGIITDTTDNGQYKHDKAGGVEKGKSTDKEQSRDRGASGNTGRNSWSENWLEIATRLCGVDDGLPFGVDGLKRLKTRRKDYLRMKKNGTWKVDYMLTKAGHRVARLKGLGNAIVPQVVMEIMKSIKQTEEGL